MNHSLCSAISVRKKEPADYAGGLLNILQLWERSQRDETTIHLWNKTNGMYGKCSKIEARVLSSLPPSVHTGRRTELGATREPPMCDWCVTKALVGDRLATEKLLLVTLRPPSPVSHDCVTQSAITDWRECFLVFPMTSSCCSASTASGIFQVPWWTDSFTCCWSNLQL